MFNLIYIYLKILSNIYALKEFLKKTGNNLNKTIRYQLMKTQILKDFDIISNNLTQ